MWVALMYVAFALLAAFAWFAVDEWFWKRRLDGGLRRGDVGAALRLGKQEGIYKMVVLAAVAIPAVWLYPMISRTFEETFQKKDVTALPSDIPPTPPPPPVQPSIPPKAAPPTEQPRLDSRKVVPVLIYAYEYEHHLGSSIEDVVRPITDGARLKHLFVRDFRLQVGIANLNPGVPLFDPVLNVSFIDKPERVRVDGSWATMLPNRDYYFHFRGPINNIAAGPDGALFVTYPSPGNYRVAVTIDGRGLKPVNAQFVIEVIP